MRTDWKTDEYLCDKFREFNRKYFGNSLSCEVHLGWRPPLIKNHAGEIFPHKNSPSLILINPKLREIGAQNYALSTLLHEMCHLSLWYQKKNPRTHGPLFQHEMKRLANLGAFNTIW